MRIKRLEYHDHARGWKLEPVEFSNLNLLVGVSGAGKTQILNAILNLRKIANGESLNGIEWDVRFSATDDQEYHWQGKYETKEKTFNVLKVNKKDFIILSEKLFLNKDRLVDRDQVNIQFQGKTTPKLSPFQSIIEILDQEDAIAPVKDNFKNIIANDSSVTSPYANVLLKISFSTLPEAHMIRQKIEESKATKSFSLQTITEENITIDEKLSLIYLYVPEEFSKIKDYFVDIFPQIEDIRIESFQYKTPGRGINEVSIIQIKEKGVSNWISEEDISAGMYKTLMYIADIYLSPKGSVILIDEFENGLGVNCIDAVTDILTERQDLQFIITSHHPYIINNIPMDCWKIVARKGGVVTVKSAEDLHLGRSKHQAYLQLINKLERYNEELESA